MSDLIDNLVRRIARTGPITIADYMAECLFHPTHGYYTTQEPFGRAGDFVTAPEISQMFGEMLGLCLASYWLTNDKPQFALAELGPGRATLMKDVLTTFAKVTGLQEAAQIHLVEASDRLKTIQRETLSGHAVTWHETTATLPETALFLIANEFFDALPIRQYLRHENGWAERMIGESGGRLALGLAPPCPIERLDHRLDDTVPGNIVEVSVGADPVMADIDARIAAHGGIALIVDYGGWRSNGDTLQAVRDHAHTDILAGPGQADLSAHVDFEALAGAAPGLLALPLTDQGVFLERLGITPRAQRLAATLDGVALDSLVAAHRRLTHPAEMGSLFKVLGLIPKTATKPEGFA